MNTMTATPTALGATALGQATLANALTPRPANALTPAASAEVSLPLEFPANFPVELTPEQLNEVRAAVNGFSFAALVTRDIPTMGMHSEVELRRHLDGFLSRIDKQNNPQLFALTEQLTERFEEAKLEEVADKILNAKPGLLWRIYGLINPKALRKAAAKVFEEVSRTAAGRSKTLSDQVNGIESKLVQEMQNLGVELNQMDLVKAAYAASLVSFAVDTAMLHNAVVKARQEFALMEPQLTKDPIKLAEAKDKLQALESRALAVEGTMSRLPADQDVIRTLQNAGISTLQELATTMTGRFSSIKMELLVIHGALQVQAVQRLGEQGAALDANLGKVRGKLMTNVVTTAAEMPGKNRKEQAEKLLGIVNQTKELQRLNDLARAKNKQEFEAARVIQAQARQITQSTTV